MAERLKLRARDAGDLETIAVVVQDALVPLSEIRYLPRERRFALMLNRFRWEAAPKGDGAAATAPSPAGAARRDARYADPAPAFERVHAALVFDEVKAAKRRGLETAAKGGILELLTISHEAPFVLLSFSGAAAIRLEVDRLSCHLEDIGEPWPTIWRPAHDDDEPP